MYIQSLMIIHLQVFESERKHGKLKNYRQNDVLPDDSGHDSETSTATGAYLLSVDRGGQMIVAGVLIQETVRIVRTMMMEIMEMRRTGEMMSRRRGKMKRKTQMVRKGITLTAMTLTRRTMAETLWSEFLSIGDGLERPLFQSPLR